MFWFTVSFICMLMMCSFILVLLKRILILVWIILIVTTGPRQMDYASILLSLNILYFRGRTDHLSHLNWTSGGIKLTNLGIVFNGRLSRSNHIRVVVGRIYSMLRNLWIVIDSTPLVIRMELAETYLITVLLYEREIFAT